jgi:predicted metallo-beta-lactamase superfamily hydrolase
MPNLIITPLAFESLGVRSSAISIKTENIKIVVDPAVALAPNRYGLSPHPDEEAMKICLWNTIKMHTKIADILVITHYHFDHMDPKETHIYAGKQVLLKHPKRMINSSQKQRAESFIRKIKPIACEIQYIDNRSYDYGDTTLCFSRPVPHGADASRGYVVEGCIESDSRFLFTSDVQGPILEEQMKFILTKNPDIIFVDGPSTYIKNPRTEIEMQKASNNLLQIIQKTDVKWLVVDHHIIRDLEYKDYLNPVYQAGSETGVSVGVAAEFLDVKVNLLEAKRKQLYES